MPDWRVSDEDAGRRLDQAVAAHLSAPRNQVQAWIREGRVTVGGQQRRASYTLTSGDQVACEPRAKETAAEVVAEPGQLEILHEDSELVVLDKQPGVAVHLGAGRARGTLVNALLYRYPELASVGGPGRPGIVHRLDIDTTGVLVVARTDRAYQRLTKAFAAREVEKSYLGIVFGTPSEPEGVLEFPLGRHPTRRKEMAVRADGRAARTGYEVIATHPGVALLRLDLYTGRTHQIRVHLKELGHPLVGDSVYAGNRWRGVPRSLQKVCGDFARPALHAERLAVTHPATGRRVVFKAPVPNDLETLWQAAGGDPISDPQPTSA